MVTYLHKLVNWSIAVIHRDSVTTLTNAESAVHINITPTNWPLCKSSRLVRAKSYAHLYQR